MPRILSKLLSSVFCLVTCLIPTFLYLGARSILSPEGFWQEFFIMGAGIYLLGFFQVILVFVFIGLTVVIWGKSPRFP